MKEPLTLDLIKKMGKVSNEHYSSLHVYDVLDEEGYTNCGWTNGGAKLPKMPFDLVYRSYTGATSIYVNHEFRYYYSEDSGD